VDEINESGIPEKVKEFLRIAAERHTVFDFSKIAEFYAHADVETQRLMENSALVIIDHRKAIENGFIQLTKRMGALIGEEKRIKAERYEREESEAAAAEVDYA
jgi:hypothetical protein